MKTAKYLTSDIFLSYQSIYFKEKLVIKQFRCYKEAKQPKKRVKATFEDYIYQKFEDYAFLGKSLYKFTFSASSSKNIAGLTNLETVKEDQICERLVKIIIKRSFNN